LNLWSGNIELYKLQDEILKKVFSLENNFYLTGGTALHRFYYNYRLSDDLDFFTNNDLLFQEYIRECFYEFDKAGINFKIIIREKDFVRITFKELKIDFVNDIAFRYGKSKIIDKYRIDNVINILTNKICAIIGRDDEKDIFDLLSICINEEFIWDEVIEIANKKMKITTETLLYRLKTFPFEWLSRIKLLDKKIKFKQEDLKIIINDIKQGGKNSLKFSRSKK